MFLTYIIKLDKIEVFRLNFNRIDGILLFSGFPGELP